MKIGLFGVGLNTYWGQFNGLLDRLSDYQNKIREKLASFNDEIEVIDAGMVDDIDKSQNAVLLLKKENIELLFIFISTYALSSTLIPIIKNFNVPIILLNLSPTDRKSVV